MEYDLNQIISNIQGREKISISYIQRNFGFSFPLSKRIFESLMPKYISSDGVVIKTAINEYFGKKDIPTIKLIFLDVDGVLNCRSTEDMIDDYYGIDDEKVSYLKEIVDKTNAKIVLISSWKDYWYKEKELKKNQNIFANHLDEKLSKQGLSILDKTEDTVPAKRGDGILRYIDNLSNQGIVVVKYIILDDEVWDYSFEHIAYNLIQTSFYKNGLEKKHIRKAIEKLC